MQHEATKEEERDKRRVLVHDTYKKDPDYFHLIFDSSSEELSTPGPDINESEDRDFLRELGRRIMIIFRGPLSHL